jgi:nickel transport protein
MWRRVTFWGLWVLLWGAMAVEAHGTGSVRIEGGVGIEATYSDGSAMSYCEVSVFSPTDRDTAFQQGNTDMHGRFLFSPDEPGEWLLVVDDGMGHQLQEKMTVTQESTMVKQEEEKTRFSKFQGTIIGLSVIFGIFGVLTLIRGTRSTSAKRAE